MGSRLTWPQICRSDEYRGRWVALDECKFDARTAQPSEGSVVDADTDLVALCARMQASDSKHCAILYCEDDGLMDERPPVEPAAGPDPYAAPRVPLAALRRFVDDEGRRRSPRPPRALRSTSGLERSGRATRGRDHLGGYLMTGLRMVFPSRTATSKSTDLPCFSRSLALESRIDLAIPS